MSHHLTRRRLLAGLGASLVAAPFVNLLAGNARAASAGSAKRLLVFFTPNGTIHRHWRPTGGETDFTFAAGSILEPLAAHKGDVVILDELDFHGATNHAPGMRAMLTANGRAGDVGGGKSVDQFVADHLGGSTRFRSLEFGVQTSAWGAGDQTRMSYAGPDLYVSPDDDPRSAWSRMFGDLAGGPEAAERLRRRRGSVLDLARAELHDLRGRLGATERAKLGVHLESLRQVEIGLQDGGATTCELPDAPERGNVYDNDLFPAITRAQIDLAVQALACGLTNVASLQLSHTVGDRIYTWLGISEGHHSLSHTADSDEAQVARFVQAERWNTEQFAYLLGRLDGLPDPEGGTLLDSTLVLWAKELGDGRMHTCESVPWVLAGGGLRTGRYLQLGGAHHAQVLVSICRRFGLTNETFGDPVANGGALEVLS